MIVCFKCKQCGVVQEVAFKRGDICLCCSKENKKKAKCKK